MIDIAAIVGGVLMFTAIVMILVVMILAARARLVSTGSVKIEINGDPYEAHIQPQPLYDPTGSRMRK